MGIECGQGPDLGVWPLGFVMTADDGGEGPTVGSCPSRRKEGAAAVDQLSRQKTSAKERERRVQVVAAVSSLLKLNI